MSSVDIVSENTFVNQETADDEDLEQKLTFYSKPWWGGGVFKTRSLCTLS